MMDTTERGMASPCEKMEAENVEMVQAKNFARTVVIEDCDTFPQTTDSGEDVEDPRSLELIFGQKHNDTDCALCPTAKRACNRAWFSAKNVEVWSRMATTTLWRWLGRLESARRISRFSDLINVNVSTSTGAVKTTFYNLNVLNQLAMACIDNEKLNDISCKFSDILSEKETEMMSGTQPQPQFVLPKTLPEALRAYAAEVEAHEETKRALESESTEHKHDNCVRNGRAGGLTKNRNFHQARADAAEARAYEAEAKADEEKAKADDLAIQLEIERGKWKTARDFCEPTRLNYSLHYLKWQVSRDLERVCEFLQEQSMLDVAPRPDGVMKFPKLAFDYLLHHFCVDPTYLQANRYDWLQEIYKNGTISSVLGDPFAGEPDILKGLKHIDEETGKVYDLGESVSEYRLHPHATSRYGVFKYNDENNNN